MGPRLRPTYAMMMKYLTGLGFATQPAEKGFVLCRHPDPDTFLLIKTLRDDDPVREMDLLTARKFLTEQGLVTDDEFDQFLVESIVARHASHPELAK